MNKNSVGVMPSYICKLRGHFSMPISAGVWKYLFLLEKLDGVEIESARVIPILDDLMVKFTYRGCPCRLENLADSRIWLASSREDIEEADFNFLKEYLLSAGFISPFKLLKTRAKYSRGSGALKE